MKKYLIYVFLLLCSHTNAQVKNYYPSADNWEVKTPVSFKMDTAKLNEAIQFAKDNETKYPKNLWLSQAMQYGKEPFSDPIGPMRIEGLQRVWLVIKDILLRSGVIQGRLK